jgi:hypothetical protein
MKARLVRMCGDAIVSQGKGKGEVVSLVYPNILAPSVELIVL